MSVALKDLKRGDKITVTFETEVTYVDGCDPACVGARLPLTDDLWLQFLPGVQVTYTVDKTNDWQSVLAPK